MRPTLQNNGDDPLMMLGLEERPTTDPFREWSVGEIARTLHAWCVTFGEADAMVSRDGRKPWDEMSADWRAQFELWVRHTLACWSGEGTIDAVGEALHRGARAAFTEPRQRQAYGLRQLYFDEVRGRYVELADLLVADLGRRGAGEEAGRSLVLPWPTCAAPTR